MNRTRFLQFMAKELEVFDQEGNSKFYNMYLDSQRRMYVGFSATDPTDMIYYKIMAFNPQSLLRDLKDEILNYCRPSHTENDFPGMQDLLLYLTREDGRWLKEIKKPEL